MGVFVRVCSVWFSLVSCFVFCVVSCLVFCVVSLGFDVWSLWGLVYMDRCAFSSCQGDRGKRKHIGIWSEPLWSVADTISRMEHWIQEWANSTIWSELCWSSSPTSSPQSLGCCAFSDFHLMGSLSGLPWLISLMSAEWTSFRVPAVCTQHRQSFLPCEHCPWQSLGVDLRRMNPQFA